VHISGRHWKKFPTP